LNRSRSTEPALIGARRAVELLERHGVRPLKRWGQNFVIDPNTIRKVVALAEIEPRDHVLELGAGAGALTVALSTAASRVTAIEIDGRLAPVLEEVTADLDNVEVIVADALDVDLDAIRATRVVGNLPYNVAVDLLLRMLADGPRINSITVMVQKEVGERLTARPGGRNYGATCLLVRFWARCEVLGKVSRNAFLPIPHVDSVIMRLDRDASAEPSAWGHFSNLVQSLFSQRRKTLRNSLTTLLGLERGQAALASSGLDSTARPEDLDFDAFMALTRYSI
jgi:16S rRNA (adenine1518-N6/adenine1519-N6)-dimethyltransferase